MSIDQVIGGDNCDWAKVFLVGRAIDDAGLSPRAFRVLGHLSRRANGENRAWPGIDSLAKICRVRKINIIEAIKELEARGFVSVERRSGSQSQYNLLPAEYWKPEPFSQTIPVPKGRTLEPFSQNGGTVLPNDTKPFSQTTPTVPTWENGRYPKKVSQEGIPFKVVSSETKNKTLGLQLTYSEKERIRKKKLRDTADKRARAWQKEHKEFLDRLQIKYPKLPIRKICHQYARTRKNFNPETFEIEIQHRRRK